MTQSPLEAKLFKRVNKWGPVAEHQPELGHCWIWLGAKTTAGYGCIRFDGKPYYTHRIAYESYFGPIPDGLSVLHRCDRPCCLSPIHLFVGTSKDNSQDALKKGRLYKQNATLKRLWQEKWNVTQRGENHPKHKLSDETVLEIRRTYKKGIFGFKRIVKRFGISFGLAQRIIAKKTWTHLKDETAPPATGSAAPSQTPQLSSTGPS